MFDSVPVVQPPWARIFVQSRRLDLHVRGEEHPELGTCTDRSCHRSMKLTLIFHHSMKVNHAFIL
jgi:hypothetical protein